MKISPARVAAFDVLKRIESERAFSAVLLPQYEQELAQNDAALSHELVLGVLRRQIYLDRLIDAVGSSKKRDLAVSIALRLGVYQLLYLDRIPDHSAINESVNLVQRAKKSSAKGYVNAVLRAIQKAAPKIEHSDETERLSVEYSHPRWLVEKWVADFRAEETELLLAANNRTTKTAFRVTARGRSETYDVPTSARKSIVVDGCFIADKMDRQLIAAAEGGKIYFQDEGSQLVGQAVSVGPGEKSLDVCASPGSKTTQIAANAMLAGDGPFVVVAGDLHFSRIKQLRTNCVRQGVGFVNVVQYDARDALPFTEREFEIVLVDAPCTGTGTIGHNPEIRYFLKPGDPAELSEKQTRILQNAGKMVKQGGRLLYSTCSLEREENEAVAERFAASNSEFEVRKPKVGKRFITEDGFARTSPARDDLDGFFIAEFERVSG